jgi:hypothetical protein
MGACRAFCGRFGAAQSPRRAIKSGDCGADIGVRTALQPRKAGLRNALIYDYHVPYSTEQSIHDFYVQRLPSSGWKCANKEPLIDVQAIQGKRSVTISSVAAGGEAAGVEMAISVSTFSKDVTDSCKS